MRKAVIAIILLIVTGVGAYFGYDFYKQKKLEDEINSNKWSVEEMGNLNLVEMTIDNDSLFTDALYALLTKKLEDGDLPASLELKINDSSTDLSSLEKILIRISNKNYMVSDSLTIEKKEPHSLYGKLRLNIAKIDSTNTDKSELIHFIENLYTLENIEISIKPYLKKYEVGWINADIPEARVLERPLPETCIEEFPSVDSEVEEANADTVVEIL